MWGGTRRCDSVPQITMPAPLLSPTMNSASAITGNDHVAPTTASCSEPSDHSIIITVR